jgi:predicted amidophosphoribosyltransferase
MRVADPISPPPGVDACRALLAYEGPAREVVAQLKYRNARVSARWLAEGMAGLVEPGEVAIVSWAPTTAQRRRARGFDQAELLARMVARRLGLPCRSLLARAPGPPQTGRTLLERRRGPVFGPRARADGVDVLLVDDVVTTGATVAAAARALRTAGAGSIVVVAAAHPP